MLSFLKNLEYKKELESYYFRYNSQILFLKNSNILITGITGMVGSAISDFLMFLNIEKSFNVNLIGIGRSKINAEKRFDYFYDDNFSFYEYDISDSKIIDDKELKNRKIDYIIHAASNATPNTYVNDPIGTMTGNFIGMKNMMDLAKINRVIKTIYISSGEAYGIIDKKTPYREDEIVKIENWKLRSAYPVSKIASETLAFCYDSQENIKTAIVRLVHTFGPTMSINDDRAVSSFIRGALNNKNIVLKSSGSQVRNYLYVFDVVLSLLLLLDRVLETTIINLSKTNNQVSIYELAEIIANEAGVSLEVMDKSSSEGKSGFTENKFQILDDQRLSMLNIEIQTTILDGIRKTIKILRNN